MDVHGKVPAPARRGGEDPPGHALPVGVPGGGVALRGATLAVWVGSLRAFPNGFDFVLRSVRAPGQPAVGRPGWMPRDDTPPVRITYADGSAVRTLGSPEDTAGPTRIGVRELGGSGRGTLWEARYWVDPLPPDGPVTLTVHPPGGPCGSVEFSGAAIREAAAQCELPWPEEDFDDGGHGVLSSASGG
ncbi:hypothetical protein [Streptomyces sp. NPDC020983]|uniref:hypothetical protein n=1 Tax=Streptomyces sp. NPDC020983 TaxID=3365106 RepID=UPI0037AFF849